MADDDRTQGDDVMGLKVDVGLLSGRFDDLKETLGSKMDALGVAMQEHARASTSSLAAVDERLKGLERDADVVRTAGGWVIRKAGPVVVAVALGMAAGHPRVQAALALALAPPVAPTH